MINGCIEVLKGPGIKHSLTVEGNPDVDIYANRNRIVQVLVNLIANAEKFSPDSHQVIIKVERIIEGAKISVTDFGIGIRKSKIPDLFDRSYQMD